VVLLNTTATFFTSSDDDTPDQESYSVTPGWTRQWTPSLTTTLNAGPQITDGDIRPTISAAASYQATRELSVNVRYSYGTGLVVGETGAQQTSSLAGSLVYQPLQDLRISVSGEWTNSAPLGGSFDEGDDWFLAGITARYQVTRWLSTYLSYQFSRSESTTGGSIPDNQVMIGVTFGYPLFF
jgi:predicted porin